MRMLSFLTFAGLLACTPSKAPETTPTAAKKAVSAETKPKVAEPTKANDPAAHGHAKGEACTCVKGKEGGTVWCEKCAKGFIGGNATKCKSCWLGKTSDKAVWCDHCKTGYIAGNRVTCKICFDHINTGGPACTEHPGGPERTTTKTAEDKHEHGHGHGHAKDHDKQADHKH